jgi:glycosyltransferase involved in cell wall biosynthesis
MSKHTLSLIFPAYNEQENIRETVEAARRALPALVHTWEIILVNDGSRDDTGRICDELAAQHPDVHVIHHPANQGYGAALKSGVVATKYDLIFFSDSDGQFDLGELVRLLEWVDRYDIVAGYRAERSDPFYRLVNAWGWKILVRLLLGLHIRDIDCAFKVFRREVFESIQIRSVGAMVNTEILAQAMRLGMRIKEVKVSHFPRLYGRQTGAKLRVILKAFRELFRLWRKLRTVSHSQQGLFHRSRLKETGIGHRHPRQSENRS